MAMTPTNDPDDVGMWPVHDKEQLDQAVEDAVTILTLRQPMWFQTIEPLVAGEHVRQMILEGVKEARGQAQGGKEGFWGSGGLRVTYNPEDGCTTVFFILGNAWDEAEVEEGT